MYRPDCRSLGGRPKDRAEEFFKNLVPPGLKSSKGEVLLSESKINLMDEAKVFSFFFLFRFGLTMKCDC